MFQVIQVNNKSSDFLAEFFNIEMQAIELHRAVSSLWMSNFYP